MNVYDERIYKLCYARKIDIKEHILQRIESLASLRSGDG